MLTYELCFSQQVHDTEAICKRFKTDLHNCVAFIQDPKKLKETIKQLYSKHVQDDTVSLPADYPIFPIHIRRQRLLLPVSISDRRVDINHSVTIGFYMSVVRYYGEKLL